MFERLAGLCLRAHAKLVDSVTAIERQPNLFVSLNEALKLTVEMPILSVKNSAVVAKSLNLGSAVFISCGESLVCVTELFLFSAAKGQGVLSTPMSLF